MSPLRVGIVGLGWVAGAHIETFRHVRGATVTAVCSRRPQDPAALQRQFGVPLTVYRDFAQMLADPEIDVIDICTPHPLHPEQAIAAARAGKHLIIEKPIALTWRDARAVATAVRKAGVQAMVCFELRYSAQFTAVRSILDKGLLGAIHYAEVDYFHGIGPWYGQFGWNVKRAFGGSSLLTAGCHALDILLHLVDAPVEQVTSYATKSRAKVFTPYQYDTTTVTIVKFVDGRVGKVTSCIDCLQPYYFHTHLVGSEGSLLDTKFHSQKIDGLQKASWSQLAVPPVDSGDVKDHPYLPQFQAFVDATTAGDPMPLTDFETALETHRVVYAADLSAAKGRPVSLASLR